MNHEYSIREILKAFDSLLKRDQGNAKLSMNCIDTGNFLEECYRGFSKWKYVFNTEKMKQMDSQEFAKKLMEFLPESGNYSWSGLKRGISDGTIMAKADLLKSITLKIVDASSDPEKVKQLLIEYGVNGSPKHITDFSIFKWSAIAFASDEKHNMIIDDPVRIYFLETYGLPKKDVIYKYKDIVRHSIELIDGTNLKMWHVNKAYAVWARGGTLGLKPMRGKIYLRSGSRNISVSEFR